MIRRLARIMQGNSLRKASNPINSRCYDLDVIDNAWRYSTIYTGLAKAFESLTQPDMENIPVGKHEIDGSLVFAIVSKSAGRLKENALLEAHEKYIDVQFVVSGIDNMGWKSKTLCCKPTIEYNGERDVRLFADEPDVWLSVRNGSFAIFFPRRCAYADNLIRADSQSYYKNCGEFNVSVHH